MSTTTQTLETLGWGSADGGVRLPPHTHCSLPWYYFNLGCTLPPVTTPLVLTAMAVGRALYYAWNLGGAIWLYSSMPSLRLYQGGCGWNLGVVLRLELRWCGRSAAAMTSLKNSSATSPYSSMRSLRLYQGGRPQTRKQIKA
ncbi:hypothetical protein BHE74_00027703 [Ensete ventricosum]|nr:hypothetical protein BHE74_00027703 [Ensete ventricosum]